VQLQRGGAARDDLRGVVVAFGGLELAFGVDHASPPVALGFGLARHRAPHVGVGKPCVEVALEACDLRVRRLDLAHELALATAQPDRPARLAALVPLDGHEALRPAAAARDQALGRLRDR
jgi:hypothetical protein